MATNRWWVISEGALLKALYDASRGEDPGIVMAELLANSDVRKEPPSDAE